MSFISDNIRKARKAKGLTQRELADALHVKRSLIGAYEEGRAEPKIQLLREMARLFGVSVDQLTDEGFEGAAVYGGDVMLSEKMAADDNKGLRMSAEVRDNDVMPSESRHAPVSPLKVLPVVVDINNEELIPIVPVKASAGYPAGLSDPQFIGSLPRFTMPVPELSRSATWRVFQVKGDSMLPVLPGSYLFCSYVESVSALKNGNPCVIVTKDEGIVYKRVYHMDGTRLTLKSDNPVYDSYIIEGADILEMWEARGVLSFEIPCPEEDGTDRLSTLLSLLQNEIRNMKRK